MKITTILFLLFISFSAAFGQQLKRKYYGTYEGKIPPYTMDIGGEILDVKEVQITVVLSPEALEQKIESFSSMGTWRLAETTDEYYVLEFRPQQTIVTEKFRLYKKSRLLVREGIYPQPDCELKKKR